MGDAQHSGESEMCDLQISSMYTSNFYKLYEKTCPWTVLPGDAPAVPQRPPHAFLLHGQGLIEQVQGLRCQQGRDNCGRQVCRVLRNDLWGNEVRSLTSKTEKYESNAENSKNFEELTMPR